MTPMDDALALQRLKTQLEVHRELSDLVMKKSHDPYVVLDAVRSWMEYMDRIVAISAAHIDGS